MLAGVGTLIGAGLGYWSGRLEAVMFGVVVGDFVSLVLLLAVLREHLSVARAMFHTGVLAATVGAAAVAIWAAGDLSIAERVLVFVVGGAVICLDAAVVFLRVGREFLPRPAHRVARNVPAPAGPAVAAAAARGDPPA